VSGSGCTCAGCTCQRRHTVASALLLAESTLHGCRQRCARAVHRHLLQHRWRELWQVLPGTTASLFVTCVFCHWLHVHESPCSWCETSSAAERR
jgi:hypothetical protein